MELFLLKRSLTGQILSVNYFTLNSKHQEQYNNFKLGKLDLSETFFLLLSDLKAKIVQFRELSSKNQNMAFVSRRSIVNLAFG
jgi:hypothetical protein